MSKIKDLKSNPEVIFNLIDVLELFSPGKKSKYTDTLLRLMKNTKNLKSHVDEIKAYFNSNFDFITNEDMNKFSDIQILLMYRFVDSFFNSGDLASKSISKNRFEGNHQNYYKSIEEKTGLVYNPYYRDETQRKLAKQLLEQNRRKNVKD